MLQQSVTSVLATTLKGGIGLKGRLPWKIPEDTKFFRDLTTHYPGPDPTKKNGIIYGRKTYEGMTSHLGPSHFAKQNAVVLTSQIKPNVRTAPTVEQAIQYLQQDDSNHVFIAGGASVYDEAHGKAIPDVVIWTRVTGAPKNIAVDVSVDVDLILKNYVPVYVSATHGTATHAYDFVVLKRKDIEGQIDLSSIEQFLPDQGSDRSSTPPWSIAENALRDSEGLKHLQVRHHEELQYLATMEDIIKNGLETKDRTGVGTYMKWGNLSRYDLSISFPLLTTKRVYWQGVVEELLWMLRGDTNANHLAEKNVHIWDANGTREFLDSRGLTTNEAGDLGPVYGFQWRHFGADYDGAGKDYQGKGVDQVAQVIKMIKEDPTSRRLIVSAWNPAALRFMALPPCHVLCQFFVDPEKKELSSLMFQRSADWGLGVPFNIASYSLLTLLIAQVTGLKAKEFVHCVGNAHVYKNHVQPLLTQLDRLPRPFPLVKIDKKIKSIDEVTSDHIKLIGYNPWPTIQMEMAV